MKTHIGSNAFLMALYSGRTQLSHITNRLILTWDGQAITVFCGGHLIGEYQIEYSIPPTNDEIKQAMQHIAQKHDGN